MKVSILGCSANGNGDRGPPSFLVNESLLIDAGTVTEALAPEQLLSLTHVFVSHSHMDHIKGLHSLADYRFLMGASGLTVAGSFAAVDNIARNIFNNNICPDFTSFPAHDPVIVFKPLEAGRFVNVAEVAVKLIPVAHTVPCTGFLVKKGTKGFMFTGD
jgi:ribonuclease BN (tRNA processing enzyme)